MRILAGLLAAGLLWVPCAAVARVLAPDEITSLDACSVCLEDMCTGEKLVLGLHDAPHAFHLECITRLVRSTANTNGCLICPLCRCDISQSLVELAAENIKRVVQDGKQCIAVSMDGAGRLVASLAPFSVRWALCLEIRAFISAVRLHPAMDLLLAAMLGPEHMSRFVLASHLPNSMHLRCSSKHISILGLVSLIKKSLKIFPPDITCVTFEFSGELPPKTCLKAACMLIECVEPSIALHMAISILLSRCKGHAISSRVFYRLVKRLAHTAALPHVFAMRCAISERKLSKILRLGLGPEDMCALKQAVCAKAAPGSGQAGSAITRLMQNLRRIV